jgi:MFS family permease
MPPPATATAEAPRPATADEAKPPLLTAAASALSITLGALPVFLLGGLAVFIRDDLGFGETQLGLAASLYYLSSAVTSVPAGRVVERLGARRGVALAGIGSALATFGIAVAGHNWPLLVLFMILAGVGNGIALPASNLAIARGIPVERQGVAFGFKQSSGTISTLLAGTAVPVIALTIGWRWAFAFVGMAAVPLVVQGARRRGPLAPRVRRQSSDVATGPLVVLALAAAGATVSGSALGAFYVESIVTKGLPPGVAGTWLAVASVIGIAARVTWGWFGDHWDRGHLRVVSALFVGGVVGFVLLGQAAAVAWLAFGTLLIFGSGWAWPGLFNYAVVRRNPSAPAAATGITGTGTFAGGILGPLGFGFLAERFSYGTAWLGVAAAMGSAAVLVFVASVMMRSRADSLEASK